MSLLWFPPPLLRGGGGPAELLKRHLHPQCTGHFVTGPTAAAPHLSPGHALSPPLGRSRVGLLCVKTQLPSQPSANFPASSLLDSSLSHSLWEGILWVWWKTALWEEVADFERKARISATWLWLSSLAYLNAEERQTEWTALAIYAFGKLFQGIARKRRGDQICISV